MKTNNKFHSLALASAALILFLILFSSTASAPSVQSVSPLTQYAYVTNKGETEWSQGTVSVINTTTNEVIYTVKVGIFPYGVAGSPNGTEVYVTNLNSGTISVINTTTYKVTSFKVGKGPSGVAVTSDGKKIYVANTGTNETPGNTVSVIDTATNNVTARVTVGTKPRGVAVSPEGKKVYVANEVNNNVSVIDTVTNTVNDTVLVGEWPIGVAVTPDGKKVYVTNRKSNNISVIDTATNTVTNTVPVGEWPIGVVVTPDGKKVYVANTYSNNISVIDTATNKITASVKVANWPFGVAVTRDGKKVYVTNYYANLTSEIETETNTVNDTVPVGIFPTALGQFIVSPPTKEVVSNNSSFFWKAVIIGVILVILVLLFIPTIIKKGADSRNKSPRNLEPVKPIPYPKNIDRWAIIVGISKYKDESLNLKYADRDAEKFYELLLDPVEGGFKEDHIKKLINEEATTIEITDALRSFVQNAGEDDIFILYFACHGSPDPRRPENIYLLTHDTDPTNIAGTALRMREIYQSLMENLYAKRVVIFADACHSAAIGSEMRGIVNSDQAVNDSFQEISKARGGVALLTSTEANGSSQEGEQWGGGHGVFTYFLLQGMLGDADGCCGEPKDGIVTVGELFDYVSENVRKATNYKQHPAIGTTSFDRNLPISISSSD